MGTNAQFVHFLAEEKQCKKQTNKQTEKKKQKTTHFMTRAHDLDLGTSSYVL